MPETHMMVETSFRWPNGSVTQRTIDWNDRDAVRRFAKVSNAVLRKGAMVTTCRIDDEPEIVDDTDRRDD